MTNSSNGVQLLVLEGDGIGPEITAATLAVLRAADAKFGLGLAFETAAIGWARASRASGTTFPDAVVEKAKAARRRAARAGVAQRLSAASRKAASIRPANCASGSTSTPTSARRARAKAFRRAAAQPIDLVIVRENTEGFYADRSMYQGSGEFMPTPDLALAVRKITRARLDPHRRGRVQARACSGARK